MGISNIPNPKFVSCKSCVYRIKAKVFNKIGRGYKTRYFCNRHALPIPRPLFGQKGCDLGKKKEVEL